MRGLSRSVVLSANDRVSASRWNSLLNIFSDELAALAQMVACLSLVQQVRGSIPGGVVNFHLKILKLRDKEGLRCTLSNR